MEIPDGYLAAAITVVAGYFGIDRWIARWRRRPPRAGEIARWSKAAIDSVAVSIEAGDFDLTAADDPDVGIVAEWQVRLEVLLAENGIRASEPELRVARAGAIARLGEIAIAHASQNLSAAVARVSRSPALRRPLRPSASPPLNTPPKE